MLTIPSRTIIRRGNTRGSGEEITTLHLEDVRDLLTRIGIQQDPRDHERTLNQLHVGFLGGRMTGQFLNPAGIDDTIMRVTNNGASQLAREVLPSRFFSGLKTLAQMDADGQKLATMTWSKFAAQADSTPRLVRTVRMRAPDGEVYRAIRSCHSKNYAPYSNREFLTDILDNAGDFKDLPVIDWHVSDTGMRIRFAGIPKNEIQLNVPVPMIEGWNSEVGLKRVVLRGGMWKLICTNGMGSWQESTEYNWIHRGKVNKIREGVESAFTNLLTTSNGVVAAYNEALTVSIDDAFDWMERQLRGYGASEKVLVESQKALTHETTTPGGRLASVVDAITLTAQSEDDIFAQYEVERIAAKVLANGRAIALRNGGRIPEEE